MTLWWVGEDGGGKAADECRASGEDLLPVAGRDTDATRFA